MMKAVLTIAGAALLAGCVTIPEEKMPITTEPREFVYEFEAPKSKQELFKIARNYFALSGGDSREITRVEDEAEGTIIGKGNVIWNYTTGSFVLPAVPCASRASMIFVAKDGKARLRMALIEGAVTEAQCGWHLPPKQDYPQIVASFGRLAKGLESAIQGDSAVEKLKAAF